MNPSIRMEYVDLEKQRMAIPVSELRGKSAGKTICITAGNDGDEYAGITAAYRIIEEFSHTDFSGRIIVLPIVNMPGFEAETSINPLDGVYPKHLYPGSQNGTASARLRYWMSTYVRQSDFWIDLHDGSLTERVHPYIHVWKSRTAPVDRFVESLFPWFETDTIVYQDIPDYVRILAGHGCGYCMFESGSFGGVQENAIARHISWTRTVMHAMGMIHSHQTKSEKHIYRKVQEYVIKDSGIWRATFPENGRVKRGMCLGTVLSYDGAVRKRIIAKQDGMLLWGKEGLRASAGDIAAGIAY